MKVLFFILFIYPFLLYSQWVQQTVPSGIDMVLTIDFVNQNSGIAGGWSMNFDFTGKVIYTTNSGVNWNISQFPDSLRAAVKSQMINSTTGYIAGAYNSILMFENRSQNYPSKNENLPRFIRDYYSGIGMTDQAGSNYKGMFLRTTNGGQSWAAINTLPSNVYYLLGMKFTDVNTGFVLASFEHNIQGTCGILKTTNGGQTWVPLLSLDTVELGNIYTFDGNNVFAGGWGRNGNTFGGFIVRSTNAGSTWSRQNFANTVSTFNDINFINATTGFTANIDSTYYGMLLKTTNSGLSWTRLNFMPFQALYRGIEFVPGTGKGIAVGSQSFNSLFISRTTDYGASWTNYIINDSSTNTFTSQRLIDQNIWFVSGGSSIGLIYKSTTGGTIGIQPISNEVPDKFSLDQNYPNPFNPSTKIKFDIPAVGNGRDRSVQIKIYDISGREAATLVNESLNPGTYEVTFDASKYSSGVYFYKLTAGDFSATKKMLLIK